MFYQSIFFEMIKVIFFLAIVIFSFSQGSELENCKEKVLLLKQKIETLEAELKSYKNSKEIPIQSHTRKPLVYMLLYFFMFFLFTFLVGVIFIITSCGMKYLPEIVILIPAFFIGGLIGGPTYYYFYGFN